MRLIGLATVSSMRCRRTRTPSSLMETRPSSVPSRPRRVSRLREGGSCPSPPGTATDCNISGDCCRARCESRRRCILFLGGCCRRRASNGSMDRSSWSWGSPTGRLGQSLSQRPTSWGRSRWSELAAALSVEGIRELRALIGSMKSRRRSPSRAPRSANRLDRPCTRQRTREVSLFAKAQVSRARPAGLGHSRACHHTSRTVVVSARRGPGGRRLCSGPDDRRRRRRRDRRGGGRR